MLNARIERREVSGFVRYFNLLGATTSFREDVMSGLAASPKAIAPKYFYDARGSALFEAICDLPEYYPTRTELAIMDESVAEMAAWLGPRSQLIELGSGASVKTCTLIEHAVPAIYVSIEISESALQGATSALNIRYPWLNIAAICGDFTKPLDLPDFPAVRAQRKAAYFPGSTIGNFTPEAALEFLRLVHQMVGPGGALLIGVDTKKDKAILDAAYDDVQGVTAQFNLNLLERINRELHGEFRLDTFRHQAFYDPRKGRIEMHLESRCEQSVRVAGQPFAFRAGETIHTEISCKYTIEEFQALGRAAGFSPERVWTDRGGMFSVHAMAAD